MHVCVCIAGYRRLWAAAAGQRTDKAGGNKMTSDGRGQSMKFELSLG